MIRARLAIVVFFFWLPIKAEKYKSHYASDPFREIITGRIGDYAYPTNPMNDRAIGFLLQGKVQSAISNYGNFINWDEHPMGLWGEYTYLPSVAFLAGIPGQAYSSK